MLNDLQSLVYQPTDIDSTLIQWYFNIWCLLAELIIQICSNTDVSEERLMIGLMAVICYKQLKVKNLPTGNLGFNVNKHLKQTFLNCHIYIYICLSYMFGFNYVHGCVINKPFFQLSYVLWFYGHSTKVEWGQITGVGSRQFSWQLRK